jgi:hypothetical protein
VIPDALAYNQAHKTIERAKMYFYRLETDVYTTPHRNKTQSSPHD